MRKTDGRNIEVTRGDWLPLNITATDPVTKTPYTFQAGDVIRFKVFEKKNVTNVLLSKDFTVDREADNFDIEILASEMKFGEFINKHVDYWYEIELNPDTEKTSTLVGYTKELGAPILTLSAEGGDK